MSLCPDSEQGSNYSRPCFPLVLVLGISSIFCYLQGISIVYIGKAKNLKIFSQKLFTWLLGKIYALNTSWFSLKNKNKNSYSLAEFGISQLQISSIVDKVECRKYPGASQGTQETQETWVPFQVRTIPWNRKCNPLKYSCCEIPWTEGPIRLQSMESQRFRHDWAAEHEHEKRP